MKIILSRHGEPFKFSNDPISADRFNDWIAKYNSAPINENSHPTEQDIAIISECKLCISSDLRRSKDSVNRLGFNRVVEENTLFREAGLPYSHLKTFKLRPTIWAAIFRVIWYLGYSKGSESKAMVKARAEEATSELIRLAEQYDVVVLVGHGIFNRFLATELLGKGFRGPKSPSSRYWGANIYEREKHNNKQQRTD